MQCVDSAILCREWCKVTKNIRSVRTYIHTQYPYTYVHRHHHLNNHIQGHCNPSNMHHTYTHVYVWNTLSHTALYTYIRTMNIVWLEALARSKVEVSSHLTDIKEPTGAAAFPWLVSHLLDPAFIQALGDALSIVECPPLLAVGLSHLITCVATPGRDRADRLTDTMQTGRQTLCRQAGRQRADRQTDTMQTGRQTPCRQADRQRADRQTDTVRQADRR